MMNTNPSDVRSYSFTRAFQVSVYVFLVLFWGMVPVTLFVGIFSRPAPNPNSAGVIALALVFVLLGYYCIDILPRIHARILISETQISQEFRDGRQVAMGWGEIERIQPRILLGRIELHASNPRREIHIETQIQGFGEITRVIRNKLSGRGSFRNSGKNS